MNFFNNLADGAMFTFYSIVILISLSNFRKLFTPSFARRHRLTGITYVCWLLFGLYLNHHFLNDNDENVVPSFENTTSSLFVRTFLQSKSTSFFYYDLILGILGISLTLTAAFDFRTHHQNVKNKASGALDQDATITFSEMIEHSFYQGLNLLQAFFLHNLVRMGDSNFMIPRSANILLANLLRYFILTVLPWAIRPFFPVNHFSSNYKDKKDAQRIEGVLYFIKKYQYAILYKHALFHGLNLSVAILASSQKNINSSLLVTSDAWRRYWLVLNTAYTFEFFLQTLVKKRYLKQGKMLMLNISLMIIGSVGAVPVLIGGGYVDWSIVFVSTVMNFRFRGYEIRNCFVTSILYSVFGLGVVLKSYFSDNNDYYVCRDVVKGLFPVVCNYVRGGGF